MRKGTKKRYYVLRLGFPISGHCGKRLLGGPYPVLSSVHFLGQCSIFLYCHPQNDKVWSQVCCCLFVSVLFNQKDGKLANKSHWGAREKSMLTTCCLSPLRSVASNCVKGGSVRMGGLDTSEVVLLAVRVGCIVCVFLSLFNMYYPYSFACKYVSCFKLALNSDKRSILCLIARKR